MRSTKCCIVLSASVNTSIPICTQPFAAHGLAAVLHLSKRKSPPLEEEKRQSQKRPSGSRLFYQEFENLRIIFKKKMKNGFKKMSQPDGCLDDLLDSIIWKRAFICRSQSNHHHYVATSSWIENLEKSLKILAIPICEKSERPKHKPERLRRTQTGMIIPVYNGPKQKECWRHERSFALTGLPCVGCAIPGVIPPSVVFSPLRG